jgi:hypothetical protein
MAENPNNLGINGGIQRTLSALETLIDTRRQTERQILRAVRRRVGGFPFADLSLTLAEVVSRQRCDLEHSLIYEVRERLQPADTAPQPEQTWNAYQPQYATEPPTQTVYSSERVTETVVSAPAPSPPPALRLRIPTGRNVVALPIELQNHRDTADVLSLSITPPAPHLRTFPLDRLYFEPAMLTIPPQSNASVMLILHIDENIDVLQEYWAEILITGAETKRLALVLQFESGPTVTQVAEIQDSPIE